MLSQQLDKTLSTKAFSWANADSVFVDIAAQCKAFAGFRLNNLGLGGKMLHTDTPKSVAHIAQVSA